MCRLLRTVRVGWFYLWAITPAPVAADEFRVTLLGTGSPAPVMRRFGPGVLIQAGGKPGHAGGKPGGCQRRIGLT
jgi:hypothetical protein